MDPVELEREDDKNTTLTQSIEVESINQAIEQIQARMSRKITLTHSRLILVGEDLAQSTNFLDIANFFEKNSEIALRLKIGFVQNSTAVEALASKPRTTDSISDKYIRMTQLERDFSLSRTNNFYSFLGDLRESKGIAFGSRLIVFNEYIIRHGGAVFSDWKLKGFLSSEETQAANWITGKSKVTVVGKTKDGSYTYVTDKKDLEIIPVINKGNIAFKVHLKTNGNLIEEKGKHLDLSKPENIKRAEALFSSEITHQINSAISKSQDFFKVDYLGFGKKLYQKDPKTFKSVNWNKEFPTIPINVIVEAKIDRFGLAK